MKRRRPCASDFSIGWICPLALEYTAAVRVLDEEYDDSDSEYTTGRIHNHNVVISCMPAGIPGTNAAASTATRMLAAYPSLKSLLLVGIAGGVPSDNTDIRLGDVVVGQPMGQYGGVVQYDFQKTLPGTFQRIGSLNAPSHSLLTAISKFKSSLSASTTRDRMRQYLTDRPPAGSDVLFQASYDHVGLPIDTCRDCRTDMIAERSQRETEFGIFFGTIASGNQVIKYGRTRDEISSTLGGILCFEMEAAGVVNLLPCLVVRGICDYADSHKNKIFQPFAASAAAACAREILSCLPYTTQGRPSDTHAELQHVPSNQQVLNSSERQRAVSSKEQVGLSAEEQQLYHESLAFKQLDSRHQTVKMAHAKTCRWILSCQEYRNWLNPDLFDQHHGFLWIKGKPGAGKSTIMKFAFTQSQKLANTARISFFFNARGDTLEKTVVGMLRSLLYQLFEQRPELHTVFTMLPTTTTLGPTPTWDIETLKYLLRACVERLQSEDQPVLCYIDALDECDEQEIRDMVSFFEQIGELVVSKKVRLHICFSSRHYPHVTIEHSIELVLEDQDGHQQDIMNYVHAELKAGRSKQVLQIKDEIILRSSGIFLWVVLVIQILNKEFDRGRIHALKQRLKEIPDGLHSLLKDIFTRDNNDMANTLLCLQWILYAARPLSREEAYFAILAGTMSSIDLVGWTAEQVDKEVMRKFLLDSSKGLTELTRGKTPTVQFIHESVRDFLREEGFADLSLGNIALGPSHEALKKCCLNYLSIDLGYLLPHLEWLPSAKSTECRELRNKVSAQCPFLAYAVENVLHHADIASGHGLQQTAVVTNFPSDAWTLGNNLYERHGVRRYSSNDSMYIFAERNYANLLKETIAAGSPMIDSTERYSHPFYASVMNGSVRTAELLLRMDSSLRDRLREPFRDRNIVSYASEKGYVEMVKLLLEYGASACSEDKDGGTPLSCAAVRGHQDIAKLLLEHGANPSSRHSWKSWKQVPLVSLACLGRVEVVELLLARGADIKAKCENGSSCLHWAVNKFNRSADAIVQLLVNKGVEIDSRDNLGRTPLSNAVERSYTSPSTVRLLLESGAGVGIKCHRGGTPLAFLMKNFQWEAYEDKDKARSMANLLLERGADIESRDTSGKTPLFHARYPKGVEFLFQHGANLEARDDSGRTALSHAASPDLYYSLGNSKVLSALLNAGADPWSRDNAGAMPLNHARSEGYEELVAILEKSMSIDMTLPVGGFQ